MVDGDDVGGVAGGGVGGGAGGGGVEVGGVVGAAGGGRRSGTGAVLITGATSVAGREVARALAADGRPIVAVARSESHLQRLREAVPEAATHAADVADAAAVARLHADLRARGVAVGALVHLVGGWRESDAGIAGQSDDDWSFLEASLTGLRTSSREFVTEIGVHRPGRLIIVSSTAVARPTARNASYAALKAAAEAWTLGVADEFAGSHAAASIIVASALAGRERALGELVVDLLRAPARVVNGQRVSL